MIRIQKDLNSNIYFGCWDGLRVVCKKKKICKCFIRDEKGYMTPNCLNKRKSVRKIVKTLDEEDLKICFEEKINSEKILYELTKTKMMNIYSCSIQEVVLIIK